MQNGQNQQGNQEDSEVKVEIIDTEEPTSTGLDENIAGLLCYVATIITGIIFLLIEKKSYFVRFHAMQSVVTFGSIWILTIVLGGIIPFIGPVLSGLLTLLSVVLWIILMIKAYQKELIKLPIVGELSDKFLENIDNK